jgi:hypothetical protein
MTIALAKMFWPLTINSSNRNIAIRQTGSTQYTATIATNTYLSAESLRAAVQTAIQAVGGGAVFNNMAVTVNSVGKFVFTDSLDPAFSFDWNRGGFTNSAVSILGFYALNYDSAGVPKVVTAPKQHTNGWYADVATIDDSLPIRDREADTVTVALSGQTKFITESELTQRKLVFGHLKPEKTYIAYETGDLANQAIENLWANGRARFRYWPDGSVEATSYDYVLDLDTIKKFAPRRQFRKKALYEVMLGCRGYVA